MQVGDLIFDLEVPGSTRETIALFSTATEDPNPIHVDETFARECGFPTVIQQGPMTTAYMAHFLSTHLEAGRLAWIDVSFVAPVFPLEPLRLQARVSAVSDTGFTIELSAAKVDGTVTARGQAQARLS